MLDTTKRRHQELLRKRLQLVEDVAHKINDVFCFWHWADLNPNEIVKRKRAIDRVFQVRGMRDAYATRHPEVLGAPRRASKDGRP